MYNSSIYPININKYEKPKKSINQNEDEKSGSSKSEQEQTPNYNKVYNPTFYGNSVYKPSIKPTATQQPAVAQEQVQSTQTSQPQKTNSNITMARQEFPNGEKTAIDYTQSKINISQVIKDFKSTTEAIGSPDDVKDTVYTYVSLVKKESEKESPNKKIIQTNLKNASQVLDEYITDTLKKPSTVVEGWIDSLFLQNVDYKYDESIVNPDYMVKLPPKKNNVVQNNTTEQADTSETTSTQKSDNPFYDTLVSARKEQNPAEALNLYSQIIEDATSQNNPKALSIAYFESGKLYDKFDSLDKAIENYTAAIECSEDDGLKAQAYMKMALIYHDSSKLQDAGENYFSSIACFGQVDNRKAQAVLLSQTGKLAGEEYNKKNAQDYFGVATSLANDLEDKTLSAKINQKAGDTFSYLNEPKTALEYYKTSASSYSETDNNTELAKDYQAAAKLMLDLGNPNKARNLLNKAFKVSLKTEDTDLTKHIQAQIAILSSQ